MAIKSNNKIVLNITLNKEKFSINQSIYKRIINNLVSNALKHTKNGKVSINVKNIDGFEIKNKYLDMQLYNCNYNLLNLN